MYDRNQTLLGNGRANALVVHSRPRENPNQTDTCSLLLFYTLTFKRIVQKKTSVDFADNSLTGVCPGASSDVYLSCLFSKPLLVTVGSICTPTSLVSLPCCFLPSFSSESRYPCPLLRIYNTYRLRTMNETYL